VVTFSNPAAIKVSASIRDSHRMISGWPPSAPVEHAPVWAGQIQVIGRALSQVVVELAAVELDDLAGIIQDRDHQRTSQVLMAGLPQHAQLLQGPADLGCRP
jgi:hypothetical protein